MFYLYSAQNAEAFNEQTVSVSQDYSAGYYRTTSSGKYQLRGVVEQGTVSVLHRAEMTRGGTTVNIGDPIDFIYNPDDPFFWGVGRAWDTPYGSWCGTLDNQCFGNIVNQGMKITSGEYQSYLYWTGVRPAVRMVSDNPSIISCSAMGCQANDLGTARLTAQIDKTPVRIWLYASRGDIDYFWASDPSISYLYPQKTFSSGIEDTYRGKNSFELSAASLVWNVTVVGSSPSPNVPPTVSITSPANGTAFTQPANIVINANASDPDGTIVKVDFYRDGILLGTDTTSPYSFAWSNVTANSYRLTTKATDNKGAVTTSGAFDITVTAPPQSDMAPSSITAPPSLTEGDSVQFKGDITNQGTAPTGANSTARFRMDLNNDGTFDSTISTHTVPSISAGNTVTITASSWTATAGTHRIEFCSDINGVIAESNEANNCRTQIITVSLAAPLSTNLTAQSIQVLRGRTTTITWVSQNGSSCSITGPGIALSGTCVSTPNACNGSGQTSAISAPSIYTFSCTAPGNQQQTKTITVTPSTLQLHEE